MDRRQFLVLLAAGAAGCQVETATPPPDGEASGGSGAGQVRASTPAGTSAPSPTSTRTERPTPTEEPTSTPTEEPTSTPTEEPTPTPSRAERAEAEIESAKQALGEAVSTFESAAGGNATLLDVDVQTEFTADRLEDPLRAAQEHFNRARGLATNAQQETVDRLVRATIWLQQLGRAQAAGHSAYEAYTEVRDAMYAGDAKAAGSAASELDPLIGSIRTRMENATSGVSPNDMTVVPNVDPELFREKNRQLRRAASAFEFFIDRAEPAARAVDHFATATETYADGVQRIIQPEYLEDLSSIFESARDQYRDAERALEDAAERFSGRDFSPSVFQEHFAAFTCSFSVMTNASQQMQVSATEAANGRNGLRKTFLKAAKRDLTGCGDALDELAGVKQLRNI